MICIFWARVCDERKIFFLRSRCDPGSEAERAGAFKNDPLHPDWPLVELGEMIESKPKNGYSGSPVDYVTKLKVLSLSATTLVTMDLSKFKYLDEAIPLDSPCRCRRGDIYLQRGNTKELVGTPAIFDTDDEN